MYIIVKKKIKKEKTMKTNIILECECSHKEQDNLYGKNKRTHNLCDTTREKIVYTYRCTVCSKEKFLMEYQIDVLGS